MFAQRQLGQGVVIADKPNRRGVTDFVNDFDATACFFYTEPTTCQDFLIALGVQVCETYAKLKLLPIDYDGTISTLLPFHSIGWKCFGIDAEEITYASAFQFKIASHTVVRRNMNDVFLHITKNPAEHIIEMHPNIGSDTAALIDVTLP